MPRLFAHTELILVVTEPVARGLLVRAERVLVVAREQVLVTRSLFLCVREAVVALLRESEFLSQDFRFCACKRLLSRAERVLIVREVYWCAQRELSSRDQAQSGPIPIGSRSELIFVRVVDRTHVRESVCVFLWRPDEDK